MRGLIIDDIAISLSASIDGRAFFYPGGDAVPGLLGIAALLKVTSPESETAFRSLLADVLLATPVLQTLNQVPAVTLRYNEDF